MIERRIGEIFTTDNGERVICSLAAMAQSCRGCMFAINGRCGHDSQLGYCSGKNREDGKDVIFIRIKDSSLENDIAVLERIVKEYPGKTIENIIVQLKSRFDETTHIS